jgi:hypothetical protein
VFGRHQFYFINKTKVRIRAKKTHVSKTSLENVFGFCFINKTKQRIHTKFWL